MTERTDEERWADAESILDGDPSEFAVQELRRRRRRLHVLVWSFVAFILVVAVATGVLIAVSGHHGHPAARHEVPVWQEITGLGLSGMAIVALAVGLVGYVRSGGWRAAWRSPALVLNRAQRRELSAQIRGRAPLEPDRVRVARHVAELSAGPRVRKFYAFMIAGTALELVGQLLTMPSAGRLIYTGVLLVVYGVLVGFSLSRLRQIRTFLDQTRPEPVQ